MQVAINDEIMVGSRYNPCGLLWYGCNYPGKPLPDGVDEKKWSKEELFELFKEYPVKEYFEVQFFKNGKRGKFKIKFLGNSFDVKEEINMMISEINTRI